MLSSYMAGHYDYRLVALSVVVSITAACTALALAGRVATKARRGANIWLAGGAIATGTGVWAQHFVGMLALSMPISVGYDFAGTLASWACGALACGVALHVSSRPTLNHRRLTLGVLYMTAGLAGMHYTGMYATRMQPTIIHDPWLVLASMLLAAATAVATLVMAFHLVNRADRRWALHLGCATIIGAGLAATHYTDMSAAHFPLGGISLAADDINASLLGTFIGIVTLFFLASAMLAATLDRRYEIRNAQFIESLREANADTANTMLHDSLTHLPTRPLFTDRVEQSLRRWQQTQTANTAFAVVWIDIDNFKQVSNAIGNQSGDQLLRKIAGIVAAASRQNDTAARVAGDRFALVLHDLPDRDPLSSICNDLLEEMASLDVAGHTLSASVGSAVCPADGSRVSELITAAEIAMYAVKMAGKNGYRAYHVDMSGPSAEESALEADLRRAIANQELVVFYQPKYKTINRRLVGAEALVRWQHPQRGLIAPDNFIPMAERCGLIRQLDYYVLDSVCAQIHTWLDDGLDVPPIAINLSAEQMHEPGLPEYVQTCLSRHHVPVHYLNIEITETRAVDNFDEAVHILGQLRDMGIRIALDDFGTGFSSLSYLTQLPVHKIKIDRTFIRSLGPGHVAEERIVQGIISLAHALQLTVIAEGVETEAQLAYLQGFGCDEVQGYLLNYPLPVDTFTATLQNTDIKETTA